MLCAVFAIQLSSHFKSPDEYAHYIDARVALWLDSRAYNNQPPLRKAFNFVLITPKLQREFDAFREKTDTPECSFFSLVGLLDYWNRHVRPAAGTTTDLYGKEYLILHMSEVDNLCQWVFDTRKACQMGKKVWDCPDLQLSDNIALGPLPPASASQPVTHLHSPPGQHVSSLMQ